MENKRRSIEGKIISHLKCTYFYFHFTFRFFSSFFHRNALVVDKHLLDKVTDEVRKQLEEKIPYEKYILRKRTMTMATTLTKKDPKQEKSAENSKKRTTYLFIIFWSNSLTSIPFFVFMTCFFFQIRHVVVLSAFDHHCSMDIGISIT